MRAVLGLAIGGLFLSVASGSWLPNGEPVPLLLRIFLLIAGGAMTLASVHHGVLRLRRRAAYQYGTQVKGTIRLAECLGSDDSTATLFFETDGRSWLISVDAGGVFTLEDHPDRTLDARAYLGEDNRIYALDYQKRKLVPLSAGEQVYADTIRALEERRAARTRQTGEALRR